MKRRAGSRRRNFSLIEILTVIAIIGVLCAIALGVVSLVKTKMAESRTRATIEKVSLTLNSLQAKFGYFPNAKDGMLVISTKNIDPENLTEADIDLGTLNTSNKSVYPIAYLKGFISTIELENLKKSCIAFDGRVVLADALERPILYRAPGVKNTGTFDLASAGVDGNAGNKTPAVPLVVNQKINTTLQQGTAKDAKTGEFDAQTSDDITNF